MYAEITAEIVKILIKPEMVAFKVERLEHAYRSYFNVCGSTVIYVNNFLTGTEQYFIQDIHM